MINHITLRVSNLEGSKKFFLAALAPLGYKLLIEKPDSAGFGQTDIKGSLDFWIQVGKTDAVKSFSCLAFSALDKGAVQDFYAKALESGGRDNGAPGYRPQYHPGYFAAFVLDPDGNNIEAVFEDINRMQDLV